MTREDAEECLRDRLKVETRYGLGEIVILSEKTSKPQWAEVKIDNPAKGYDLPRCLYMSSLCRYMSQASDLISRSPQSIH